MRTQREGGFLGAGGAAVGEDLSAREAGACKTTV